PGDPPHLALRGEECREGANPGIAGPRPIPLDLHLDAGPLWRDGTRPRPIGGGASQSEVAVRIDQVDLRLPRRQPHPGPRRDLAIALDEERLRRQPPRSPLRQPGESQGESPGEDQGAQEEMPPEPKRPAAGRAVAHDPSYYAVRGAGF